MNRDARSAGYRFCSWLAVTLTLLAIGFYFLAHTDRTNVVMFVLPDGYTGYFWVVFDSERGQHVRLSSGNYRIKVPENGIALVDDMSFDDYWHKLKGVNYSGKTLYTMTDDHTVVSQPYLMSLSGDGTRELFLFGTQAERDKYFKNNLERKLLEVEKNLPWGKDGTERGGGQSTFSQ